MQINTDIALLKTSLNSQATACEKMLEVSDSFNQHLVVVENSNATDVGSDDSARAGHLACSTSACCRGPTGQ